MLLFLMQDKVYDIFEFLISNKEDLYDDLQFVVDKKSYLIDKLSIIFNLDPETALIVMSDPDISYLTRTYFGINDEKKEKTK